MGKEKGRKNRYRIGIGIKRILIEGKGKRKEEWSYRIGIEIKRILIEGEGKWRKNKVIE